MIPMLAMPTQLVPDAITIRFAQNTCSIHVLKKVDGAPDAGFDLDGITPEDLGLAAGTPILGALNEAMVVALVTKQLGPDLSKTVLVALDAKPVIEDGIVAQTAVVAEMAELAAEPAKTPAEREGVE